MRRPGIVFIILVVMVPLLIQGSVLLANSSASDNQAAAASPQPTPTQSATGSLTPTPTQTPTSYPGPPTLIAPEDDAVLPQPVSPTEWVFQWSARCIPICTCSINIGTDGYIIPVTLVPSQYDFHYSRAEPFPTEALGPWDWMVHVWCPLGSNYSETHTFWIEPAGPTATLTPTETTIPTDTLTPTPTESNTLTPTATPSPTDTPTLTIPPPPSPTPTPAAIEARLFLPLILRPPRVGP
jgi:hypothetical protein